MTGIVVDLLKLLFGQVGVIGTICLSLAIFLGWLYREEIRAHMDTRRRYEDINEKRFELLQVQGKTLGELKDTIALLAAKEKGNHWVVDPVTKPTKGDGAMLKYAATAILCQSLQETASALLADAEALKKKVLNGAAVLLNGHNEEKK